MRPMKNRIKDSIGAGIFFALAFVLIYFAGQAGLDDYPTAWLVILLFVLFSVVDHFWRKWRGIP